MPIPDFQPLMRPTLVALADAAPHRSREVVARVSDDFGLSAQERQQLLPSGSQPIVENRVHCAMTHLAKAGLLKRPQREYAQITAEGQIALK